MKNYKNYLRNEPDLRIRTPEGIDLTRGKIMDTLLNIHFSKCVDSTLKLMHH